MELPPPPKKLMFKFQPPVPWNVTVFGDRVFAKVMKLKQGRSGGLSSNITSILIKRGHLEMDTQREDDVKKHREDRHQQDREKGLEQILPSGPQKEPTLLTA